MWFEEEKKLKNAGKTSSSKRGGDADGFKMNLDF